MMNEFIFEDSEIPDLVLETIIGFLVEMMPMEKWREIRVVSKRWNRIAKPVLKETFKRAWPKFVLQHDPTGSAEILNGSVPEIKPSALSFSRNRDMVMTERGFMSCYRWGWVEPISLRSVVVSGKPICVEFIPSNSSSIYVGVFLMESRQCQLLHKEVGWDPSSPDSQVHKGRVCSCVMGACSGDIYRHSIRGEQQTDILDGAIGDVENVAYKIVYQPGGVVIFDAPKLRHGQANLEEAKMLERFGDSAVIVFGVGISSSSRRVPVRLATS